MRACGDRVYHIPRSALKHRDLFAQSSSNFLNSDTDLVCSGCLGLFCFCPSSPALACEQRSFGIAFSDSTNYTPDGLASLGLADLEDMLRNSRLVMQVESS